MNINTPTSKRRIRLTNAIRSVIGLAIVLSALNGSAVTVPAQAGIGAASQIVRNSNDRADAKLKGGARVNPSTLALEFTLPLMNYPGRNGNDISVAFSYSSKVWRMKSVNQWWYPVNSRRKYVTDLVARFSEKTAAGWTSSLRPPVLDETVRIYDQYGRPYSGTLDQAQLDSMWGNLFSGATAGLMPGGNFNCASYSHVYCPDCRLPDGTVGAEIYVCNAWEIGGGVSEPSSGGGAPPSNEISLRYVKRLFVTMPNGLRREFRQDDEPHPCGTPATGCETELNGVYLSVDGSGMRLEKTGEGRVLWLNDGGRYFFPAESQEEGGAITADRFLDANGNEIRYGTDQGPETVVRSLIDTIGRKITDPLPRNWNSQRQTQSKETMELPGFAGSPQKFGITWSRLKPPGCEASADPDCSGGQEGRGALRESAEKLFFDARYLCRGSDGTDLLADPSDIDSEENEVLFPVVETGVRTCSRFAVEPDENGVSTASAVRFNPVVISEVRLPNGQSYQFKYNRYGEISRLTYPAGSYEEFDYGWIQPINGTGSNSYDQTNRGVTARRIYDSSGNVIQRWRYRAARGPYSEGGSKYTVTSEVSKSGDPNSYGLFTERVLNTEVNDAEFGLHDPLAGTPRESRYYDELGRLRKRVLTKWLVTQGSPGTAGARDPRRGGTLTVLFEPQESFALISLTTQRFDDSGQQDPAYFSGLNVAETRLLGFRAVDATLARDGTYSALLGEIDPAADLVSVKQFDYLYDPGYKERNINGLVSSVTIREPRQEENILGKTEYRYDEASYPVLDPGTPSGWRDPQSQKRGNITTARTLKTDTGAWVETHTQFDKFGNIRKTWDAGGDNGKYGEIVYGQGYGFAYPTRSVSPAPDPSGISGSNEAAVIEKAYDLSSGLVLSVTDLQRLNDEEDDRITRFVYDDPLLRQTSVIEPGGAKTETVYIDTAGATRIRTRKQFDTDTWRESLTHYDSFGRAFLLEDEGRDGIVFTETRYDAFGRIVSISNPYTGSTLPSGRLWNRIGYDSYGRKTQIHEPQPEGILGTVIERIGYGIFSVDAIGGTYTVSSDASGRSTRILRNVSGKIVRVDEPTGNRGVLMSDLGPVNDPHQPTRFKYDHLGNLVEITQGTQKRFFMYDSFGRLIRVRQPEQGTNPALRIEDPVTGNTDWTAAFEYDQLGNRVRTIDANGTATQTAFDRLNRPVSVSYSDGTSPVSYTYDNLRNGKGALIAVSNDVSSTEMSDFNVRGLPRRYKQTIDGVSYSTGFSFNPGGLRTSVQYPSGRVSKTDYDQIGLPARVWGVLDGSYRTYASGFGQDPFGNLTRVRLGNGKWESAAYNTGRQLILQGLGHSAGDGSVWRQSFIYGETDEAGNVDQSRNSGSIARVTTKAEGWPDAFVQTFSYDPLNRLIEAKETSGNATAWERRYRYDRFGNRVEFTGSTGNLAMPVAPVIDQATNRFAEGQGFGYDRNGSLLSFPGGLSIDLDALNRQVRASNSEEGVIGRYFYDALGRRVKKVSGPETTIFVYAGGELVAEYSTTRPENPTTRYLTRDHLGSPRVITDADGNVISRRDYMPFGGEIYSGVGPRSDTDHYGPDSSEVRQRFTGYHLDRETGLSYASARMYDDSTGRFTAPDPLLSSADIANPQSFNRYSYAFSDPVNLSDPSGLVAVDDWYVREGGKMEVFRTDDTFDRFFVYDGNKKVFVLAARLEKNDAGLVNFPSRGAGFTRYNAGERGGFDPLVNEFVGEGDHYLRPLVAAALFGLTNELKNLMGITIALGDMSSSNGSDPWDIKYRRRDWSGHHATHGHKGVGVGLNIDFRYVDSGGRSRQGNWSTDPELFDRGKNQSIFERGRIWGFSNSLRGFNVPLPGVRAARGHNNHGHLGFDPGRKAPAELRVDRKYLRFRNHDGRLFCVVEGCLSGSR